MVKLKANKFFLTDLFGDTVQIKILETMLKLYIQESHSEHIIWKNLSEIARSSNVAKSSAKRSLDLLKNQNFVEEQQISTHAQNPPRLFRINPSNLVIKELIFFYKKIRGLLL